MSLHEYCRAMDSPMTLLRRANRGYQARGSTSLARRGLAFVRYCLFDYRSYYLYTEPVGPYADLNEADFLPRVDGFTAMIVSSNEEADELEACGLTFRAQIRNARRSLDSGAAASCLFVDKKLAHIGWAAFTREGQKSIGNPPFSVDYSNHEACSGGSWTHPEYRRLGLQRYSRLVLLRFMLQKGIRIKRAATAKNNPAAEEIRREYPLGLWGEGRYLRVLWWKSWKERPLSPAQLQTDGEEHG